MYEAYPVVMDILFSSLEFGFIQLDLWALHGSLCVHEYSKQLGCIINHPCSSKLSDSYLTKVLEWHSNVINVTGCIMAILLDLG